MDTGGLLCLACPSSPSPTVPLSVEPSGRLGKTVAFNRGERSHTAVLSRLMDMNNTLPCPIRMALATLVQLVERGGEPPVVRFDGGSQPRVLP